MSNKNDKNKSKNKVKPTNKADTTTKKDVAKNKKKKDEKWYDNKILKLLLGVVLFITILLTAIILKSLKDVPKIDPKNVESLLSQNSMILDQNGELIEKIHTEENRTIVNLDKIPKHLQDAYIAIEDERFEKHIGIDMRGIMGSLVDNLMAGKTVRGASTITQQLSRNLYLSNEKKLDRKIKEAYLALKLEASLSKDEILEAYLNRIYLGQGAYGVQEAAQTYFSKNVEDLTIAESAAFAGIVKSPTKYSIYKTVKPENFDSKTQKEVGTLDILGEKYIAIFNENAEKRQKIVLKKMFELKKISKSDYEKALKEDISLNIKPGTKKASDISSYFNDYIKEEATVALMNELKCNKEEAQKLLFNGGLKIYSTMDLSLQRKLEHIYNNFTNVLGVPGGSAPALISWRLDGNANIIDQNNKVIFRKQTNILTNENKAYIDNGNFTLDENGLTIDSPKINIFNNKPILNDYYTRDDNNNLVTHKLGAIIVPENYYSIIDNNKINIKKEFLDKTPDFYEISPNNNLLIGEKYFYNDKIGTVQPQSASVIIDHKSGQIKALVGGRDAKGVKILNRATKPRQPGSTIKPLAAYLPALDNGYTAASPIDDVPFMQSGKVWPNNWYTGFRGLMGLRKSVEQSVNVNSVKMVQAVGIQTSISYLEKMGIISNNPKADTFIKASEDSQNNDENLSALGLGGMSKGISPLKITGAFASIANDGSYQKPISFTKIVDKDGKILVMNKSESTEVVSAQTAYIMKDILRTTVTEGIAGRAKIPNMTTAGKTGTTQDKADAWFAGFTPYYSMSTWIGNDNPQIKLNQGSAVAAQLWRIIMTSAHEGLEYKEFDRPEGIVSKTVCTKSGKLANSLCSSDPLGDAVRTELFIAGTEPTTSCDVHISADVCSVTNLLPGENCSAVSKVFIKRPGGYDPNAHGGIFPLDYEFTLPHSYCDSKHSILDTINDLLNKDDETDSEKENNDNENNEDNSNNNQGNENNQNKPDNKPDNKPENKPNNNGNSKIKQ